MADASLNIPITADASKFISTLGQVEDKLKELKAALKDAVGGDIAKINFDIQGLEQQKKSIKEFGQFAEGTYGRLLQQLDYLKDYKLTLKTDSEEFNRTIGQIKEIEDTINRVNGKGIKLEAEIVQPPKGSIQYYEDRIKALKTERVVLTADSKSLERANVLIDGYTNRIKNLKSQGISVPIVVDEEIAENSILGIRKKIDELNAKKIRIGVSNEGEIAKLNSEIKGLEQEVQKANNLSIDEKGGIVKSSNKARQAITSLSLVAQDLPFGFIAIQNNLPAVLENFTALNTKSGGLKGALKDLGSTLLGPAGIFLAFSAVTAAVTYAVKEYGSFGNAVDALFGKLDPLYKLSNRLNDSVEKFNKELVTTDEVIAQASGSTEAQIIKMKQLSQTVLNTSNSEQLRKYALKEMQGIDEARFGRYDVEKGKLDGLVQSVNAYTQSIIANSVAQKLSDKASDALIVRNQALNLFETQSQRLNDIKKQFPNVIQNAKKYRDYLKEAFGPAAGVGKKIISAEALTGDPNVDKLIQAEDKLEEYRVTLNSLNKEYLQFRKGAINATDESIKLGAALVDLTDNANKTKNVFAPQIDSQALDEAYNLDSIISNLTKYGNILIDVNKSESERKNALRELNEINPQYFQSFVIGKSSISEAKTELEGFIRTLLVEKKTREDSLRVSQLNADFRKNEEKGIISLGDKYNIFSQQVSSLPTTMKEIEDGFEEAALASDKLTKSVSPLANIERVTEPLKFLQDQFQLAYTAINKVFFDPLQSVFEKFLTKGEISLKGLTKAVGKSIADIAAKLAATGVIKGLLLLFDPSGALAGLGGSFGGIEGGNGILDALGGIFGKKPKSPNFNGVSGSRPGGERVEFTIRGTNLVGVLNRANGEINRIG
jgi:hypothetical protein